LTGTAEQMGQHDLAACSVTGPARHGLRFGPIDRHHWRRLARPVLAAAALGAATGVIAVANPFKHHVTPPCPFHAVTGLWCPLCGGTRAVWAATHGDFRLMLHANILFPAIVVLIGWTWLGWAGRATGWWRLPVPKGRGFKLAVVAVLVAFTVLRNLPGLGALAPPSVA
jgi:hypothetical protein